MEDLIKALQIFLKYGNPEYPTNCSHDLLFVNIDPELVSEEDVKILDDLGFVVDEDLDGFSSFRFGSC
jgi:DNA-binding protein YbaB